MTSTPGQAKAIWFPTVDYERCVGCRECYDFCKNGVFDWDSAENHPVVAQPERCVPGCKACAKICDQEAISFPARPIWCTCGAGDGNEEPERE